MAIAAAIGLVLAGCGSSDSDPNAADTLPTIVVTTNVLGDVLEQIVGDAAEVVTIMPVGADPHDFQASAKEVATINSADALIVNGAGFEEGLLDVIEGAESEGVPIFEAISVVDTIEFGGHRDGDHDDEDHDDEPHEEEDHDDAEHDEHDDNDHDGVDPHFFTDPVRMAQAIQGVVGFLEAEVAFDDPAALRASADVYVAELTELDNAVVELVDKIPQDRRVLVTNHEVFGYFADRYGFEVVGVIIPGGSTTSSASAGELAALGKLVEAEGVPAIFADTSTSADVVEALAAEAGGIAIVELYTESLGASDSDGATYLDMVRSNADRISGALR